jgi:hypothetical protein
MFIVVDRAKLLDRLSRQNRRPVRQHKGFLSFVSSLTRRIRHKSYPVPEWVHQRVYLHPYPKELVLRDHLRQEA